MTEEFNIVFIGLSITSSWGNGHATTYRGLIKSLAARGHSVLFLERDTPCYAGNRDMPHPPFCRTELYSDFEELRDLYEGAVKEADFVIVGSYVYDGVRIGRWVTSLARRSAFYDIDTPVTLRKLAAGDFEYIEPSLIPSYDLYLSFTGGPTLKLLENHYGSPRARALYCSFDPEIYYPEPAEIKYDLGYLGTYSDDRQPALEELLIKPAALLPKMKFAVIGPMYPENIKWRSNIYRNMHLSPSRHRAFYNSQRFTLNVTRLDMIRAGYSPSVRLFEASACGTPIISDYWKGIEDIFQPGKEILIAFSADDVSEFLSQPDDERLAMGERAMTRVLSAHTSMHRAAELEEYISQLVRKVSL